MKTKIIRLLFLLSILACKSRSLNKVESNTDPYNTRNKNVYFLDKIPEKIREFDLIIIPFRYYQAEYDIKYYLDILFEIVKNNPNKKHFFKLYSSNKDANKAQNKLYTETNIKFFKYLWNKHYDSESYPVSFIVIGDSTLLLTEDYSGRLNINNTRIEIGVIQD